MATLEIRKFPDPVLRRRARAIRRVDDAVRKLARDMLETMREADGAGLAANQVGVLRRLIVLQLPEEDPRVLVNPEITRREGTREVEEGCLSVPGYVGLIERAVRVKARALDEWGGKFRLTAEELLAQVIEHEVDHLDGILYLDHLESHEDLRRLDEEDGVHSHDVEYHVEADHSEGDEETAAVEHLLSRAALSQADPDAPLSEYSFELSDGTVPDVARLTGRALRAGVPRGRRRESGEEDEGAGSDGSGRGAPRL
ncbi:MAG: peptide deformylase [Chloroflexi bacterium]|nr:peptide deformylase [Chloroflexota bacterium]